MKLTLAILFFLINLQLLGQTKVEYGSNNGQYLEVNNTKIYYEQYGEGSPVLLLHGGMGSISNFDTLIPDLSKHFKLIAIDSPSHGRSYSIDSLSYNIIANNISVIKRSLVKHLNLTYIESDFYVTAFTGQRVDSDIAIAKSLKIGELTFKNVVFLVLNDKDISFPQIDYYINGIIGFPVIEAMEEIRISKNDSIHVPQNPVEYNLSNFALDGLTPIIAVNYKKDTLSFGFDTGARVSTLYAPFYEKYKNEVNSNYEPQKFKSGSAGGVIEFEGYIIEDIVLKVGESNASLKNLQLHKYKIGTEANNLYGNFGQDYIKQFDEMIISFKNSFVLFK